MKEFETDDESSIWPWVTGIVVLAMVIWVAAELSTGNTTSKPDTGAVITTQTRPRPAQAPAVDPVITPGAFSAWVSDSAAAPEWSDDDAFVQAGLGRLAAALGGLALGAESTELQQRVAALQQTLAAHAGASASAVDSVRAAMLEAGAIAAALREQPGTDEGGTDDIATALDAAHELDPAQPLPQQRQAIHRYLAAMAESLITVTP